jgi:hypothetical protein
VAAAKQTDSMDTTTSHATQGTTTATEEDPLDALFPRVDLGGESSSLTFERNYADDMHCIAVQKWLLLS